MAYDPTIGTWDFGFLPPNFNGDVQPFMCDNNAQGSFKWIKPRGVTMCYMVCIGGGAGGGGGLTGATTTARGGGAGGASSGLAKMIVPAIFLPDVLSIQVGNGGAGKGSGVAGNAGTNSIISYGAGISAIGTIPNIILQSNNAAPGGGQPGTGSGAATGGSVSTISTEAISGAGATHGIQSFLVGKVGAAGGTPTAAGSNAAAWLQLIGIGPGSGGGGVTSSGTGFAGGIISIQASFDFADGVFVTAAMPQGGVAGGAGAAGNGNAGIQLWKPFYMSGGSGGGSSDGSTGGNGGNGGIGCGGGGGGAGATGGTGGNGGNGFVAIISW